MLIAVIIVSPSTCVHSPSNSKQVYDVYDLVQTESEGEVSYLLDNLRLREKQQFVSVLISLIHHSLCIFMLIDL